jgi:mono/diheme cytochrome c family protein
MDIPSKRKQFIGWIAASILASASLIAVLVWNHGSVVQREPYIIGDAGKGHDLFFGKKQCSICHSINGVGGRIAPDLSGMRPTAPAMAWLTTVLWNHAPGMWRQLRNSDSYPHLNQQEMAHLLAYLYAAANTDRPGDAGAGKLVFEIKSCVRCHSVRSQGSTTAPDLSTVAAGEGSVAWTRAMWNHAQSMVDTVRQAAGEWPHFSGSEMNDLLAYVNGSTGPSKAAYLSSQSAERGWAVFQAKCMQCHSVGGQGGKIGPSLGPETDLPLSTSQFAGVLWNHAPAMIAQVRAMHTALPKFENNEMADLQAFLASLRYFEPSGSPLLGQTAFNARGCAHCHGSNAEGTHSAPRLRPRSDSFTTLSFATALWSHSSKIVTRAEELGVPWPVLEPNDVGNLVSYLNDSSLQK